MANIRLQTISIENSTSNIPLTIQNGNILITNTSISSNVLNGSLVIDGGIGINCTYDGISSTSGGALTIGGGLAVNNQAFLGSNLILDSNTSTISVKGVSDYRLFLDTINNKHFYLTLDGVNRRFDLYDTFLQINLTSGSLNATTGSFIINGGISINSTINSVNSSNGGALTIGGGLSIGGDAYFSKTLTLGQLYQNTSGLTIRYTGNSQIALQNSVGSNNTTFNMNGDVLVISNANDYNFNTSIGNFIFENTNNTLLTIHQSYSDFSKYVTITDTIESLNLSTGSLIITGGLSINCTTDAISNNNGGGLTLGGGLAINKKTYTGDSIGIQLNNGSKYNKMMLYQYNSDLTQSYSFTGLGVTMGNSGTYGSMTCFVPSSSNDFIFYSAINSTSGNEVFRIKGTNQVNFIGNNQVYSIIGGGYTVNDISFQGQSIATESSVNFFTTDGDNNDNNDLKIFGLGLPNNVTNSEFLKIGFVANTIGSNYILSTNNQGTGISRPLVLQTSQNIDQLILVTDGSLSLSSNNASVNSSTGALVLLSGGLSINNTQDASSLKNGGGITCNGGISVNKSMYVGNVLNIYSTISNVMLYSNSTGDLIINNASNTYLFGYENTFNNINTYNSNISLYSLNNGLNYELFQINTTNTGASGIYNINSISAGTGVLRPIQLNVGSNIDLYINTSGNIGINTLNPTYTLDVNGTMRGNNYNYLNSLTVYNTADATSISSSGSLSILGGTSIEKSLWVGGNLNALSNAIISGDVSIESTSSNALTISGGVVFNESLQIGQNLIITGNIESTISNYNTLGSLLLESTNSSINLSTGSLLMYGGIIINNTENSLNISNGGTILTTGGASINKDLYIGGNIYNYGSSIYNNTIGSFIQVYDISNTECFSFDKNLTTGDLSISRYNTTGAFLQNTINISRNYGSTTFFNTTPSLNQTTGSLIVAGGITIQCTSNSTTITSGGALTVFGGLSVQQNTIVGGVVTINNTTISNNPNQGALIVDGGVGISGNVNILGNTIITGNLSISGTTTSVYSTDTLISDNIIVVNSGPSGTADAGIMTQRYQIDNNTGSGDVVNDPNYYPFTLPSQTGMTSVEITLPTTANINNNYYNNWWIKVTSGFSINQVRKIIGYVGSTQIATIDSAWTNQNPNLGDTVQLYDRPYVGLIWNAINTRFELGTTTQPPGEISVDFTEYVPLFADSVILNSTALSINSTYGSVLVNGGLSISSTTDATSVTSGNGLTIAGGASIAKTLYVGNSIYSSSDKNLKKNITPLPNTLNKIKNINPIKYNSLNINDTKDYIGFIAQEFKKDFPELLHRENDNASYSLAYDRITALNFKCIKELIEQVEVLKNIINTKLN